MRIVYTRHPAGVDIAPPDRGIRKETLQSIQRGGSPEDLSPHRYRNDETEKVML